MQRVSFPLTEQLSFLNFISEFSKIRMIMYLISFTQSVLEFYCLSICDFVLKAFRYVSLEQNLSYVGQHTWIASNKKSLLVRRKYENNICAKIYWHQNTSKYIKIRSNNFNIWGLFFSGTSVKNISKCCVYFHLFLYWNNNNSYISWCLNFFHTF